jgi:hypothetical protein
MKIYFLFILFEIGISCVAQKNGADVRRIQNYVQFLNEKGKISAKDYILKQFEKHDIVIIAERFHQEKTQYELINDVISDHYFISKVGNICVEIGSENFSDSLNSYLKNNQNTLVQGIPFLLGFQRNISFYPLWNRNSYFIFLRNLFLLNKTLNPSQKINLYLCDREFDWNKIDSREDWNKANNNDRDSIMAKNISMHYERIKNSPGKKMLVILNNAHAVTNLKWQDYFIRTSQKRAGQYLAARYGQEKIASICINCVRTNEKNEDIMLQEGYWDAAFSITNHYDTGFDFKNSPFGIDTFDFTNGRNNEQFRYQDIFTGFVYYLPLTKHQLSLGVPGLAPPSFREEFLRRIKICNGDEYYLELKRDSILSGWNKEECSGYDDFSEKIKTIEYLKEQYLKESKHGDDYKIVKSPFPVKKGKR